MNITHDDISDVRISPEEYARQFDTDRYLCMYALFELVPAVDFIIENLVRIFIENHSQLGHDRALEFGGGPSLLASFILAQQVESIRFSDYVPSNLNAVADWIKGTPNAHDWSELFDRIIQEYQKQGNNMLEKRSDWEKRLHKAIEHGGLSKCDVNAVDCPILGGERNQYDIVLSSMCLEEACATYDLYKATIKRLYALLKENGLIILIHGRNQTYYIQNELLHVVIPLDKHNVIEALQEACFIDIHIESRDLEADSVADGDGIMAITAYKPKVFP